MVTTDSHGFNMIEPQILFTSPQCTLVAQEIVDISQNEPFHILISNFLDRDAWIPNHVKIIQKAEPLSIINP